MTVLEIVFTGGVAAAILFFLGMLYFLIKFVRLGSQLRRLPRKKRKNKKKNRQFIKRRQQLLKKKKNSLILMLAFLLISGGLAGGTAYFSYYQSMNLSAEDTDLLVNGYYLLSDFEEQLILAGEKGDDEAKLQKNIRYLATVMASYNGKKASGLNTEEGQLTLNRYYNSVKQLGMNASTQAKNFYGNPELVESLKADIARAKEYEAAVFNFYKVNESALLQDGGGQ